MEKENELKTLKEIEVHDSGTYAMSSELRAEAVKWIKYFGNDFNLTTFTRFFNLTEEDLK